MNVHALVGKERRLAGQSMSEYGEHQISRAGPGLGAEASDTASALYRGRLSNQTLSSGRVTGN